MSKLLIFGGTSEEHGLLKALEPFPLEITLCVASDYGRLLTPADYPGLKVLAGRLDAGQMTALMRCEGFFCVIDATHPYAVDVTKNIRAAAAETGTAYLRLLRERCDLGNAVVVETAYEAALYLGVRQGNVLLTTGSKELAAFTAVGNYQERLYPRVLPTVESISACLSNGYPPNHIIAMHGPFSRELNIALMRQFHIKTLVTKDGGRQGGFPEKLAAAEALGADIIVIARPEDNGGLTEQALITRIEALLEDQQ